MSNQTNHQKHRLTSVSQAILAAIASTCSVGIKVALADPPAMPPPETKLPPVFCFRFTDIKAVEDDPEGDKFQLSFEVLNWSNQHAAGVRIALTEGSTEVDGKAPTFAGAGVDGNGRPLGPDADPLPGNQLFSNTSKLVQSTDSAIQWDTSQLDFNTFVNGAIPNRDLLGVGPRNTPAACALVPGCRVVGHSNPFFGTPEVADWDTVDDGDNVLDGFVITVDDFDELEVISFNWDLLNVDGNRIGDTNDYGFGTVNIARLPIHEDSHANFTVKGERIFEGNTGVASTKREFAENSYLVKEFSPVNYDRTLASGFSGRNAIATETNGSTGEEELIAIFAAEFGAGITGPFLNPEDNIFNSPVNAKLVNNPTNNGSGSSGPGSSGSGSSGSDSSGSDSSGSGSSGSDSSGSDSSGSGSSGSGSSGSDSSGSGSSGSGSSGSGSSGSGSSGSGSSGSGSSGSGSSDGIRTSVPEPSIIAMLGMTAIAIFGYKRQRPN